MISTTVLESVLKVAILDQPWYRRYANTVTALAAGLVVLGTWVTATWVDLPAWAATAIGTVVMVASVLAQRATKNGLTPRGTKETLDVLTPQIERGERLVRETAGEVAERAQGALLAQQQNLERRLDDLIERIDVGGRHALRETVDAASDAVDDPIALATERGWVEHDPRFLGLSPKQAAIEYLQALR